MVNFFQHSNYYYYFANCYVMLIKIFVLEDKSLEPRAIK